MKSFIVFALCVAAALAAPPYNGDPKLAETVKNEQDNIGVDGFKSVLETTNGIVEQREGNLVNQGTDDEALVVRGQFSYPGPDGVTYTVTYTADSTGYHPQGDHLPK
ncbi:flexible cuticle protein 12-like [Choristoneura fumiferana]|uniref:flexible cuticle protein 12-like n=1 Tax=Choristoneura fumiferana TaxID=7141 RepID=UPI003D154A3A